MTNRCSDPSGGSHITSFLLEYSDYDGLGLGSALLGSHSSFGFSAFHSTEHRIRGFPAVPVKARPKLKMILARLRHHSPLLLGIVLIAFYFTERGKKLEVDPVWEKTVVALELRTSAGFLHHGTAFLIRTDDSPTKQQLILVTAKHLIASLSPEEKENLSFRYRSANGGSGAILNRDLVKAGAGDWFFHPSADVACRLFGHYSDADVLGTATNRFLPTSQTPPNEQVILSGFPHSGAPLNPYRVSFSRGYAVNDNRILAIQASKEHAFDGGPVLRMLPKGLQNSDTLAIAGFISNPKGVRVRTEGGSGVLNEKNHSVVPCEAIIALLDAEEFRALKSEHQNRVRGK